MTFCMIIKQKFMQLEAQVYIVRISYIYISILLVLYL